MVWRFDQQSGGIPCCGDPLPFITAIFKVLIKVSLPKNNFQIESLPSVRF